MCRALAVGGCRVRSGDELVRVALCDVAAHRVRCCRWAHRHVLPVAAARHRKAARLATKRLVLGHTVARLADTIVEGRGWTNLERASSTRRHVVTRGCPSRVRERRTNGTRHAHPVGAGRRCSGLVGADTALISDRETRQATDVGLILEHTVASHTLAIGCRCRLNTGVVRSCRTVGDCETA